MTALREAPAMMPNDRVTREQPARGSIVRYRVDGGGGLIATGVVTGPVEPDPSTDQFWVGIRKLRDDERLAADLIAMASIVEVLPPPYRWDTEGR